MKVPVLSMFLLCVVVSSFFISCARRQELPGDFGDFASRFRSIKLPWSINNDSVNVDADALSGTDVKRYLNIDADSVYAAGIVRGDGYLALICRVQWDEQERSTMAIFFNHHGGKTGELVLAGTSGEVPEHIAYVEHMRWQGNVINRNLVYHRDGEDAKSYNAVIATTIDTAGSLKNSPDKILRDVNQPAAGLSSHNTEIATYLSPDAPGVELTGIFPEEDTPVYLIHESPAVRRLSINEDEKVPAGMAIKGDNTFSAIEFSSHKESTEGVTFFSTIALYTRTGKKITFRQAMIKREAVPIGALYTYQTGKGDGEYGNISLHDIDPLALHFSLDVNTGAPHFQVCSMHGVMVRKNNIGYYQASQVAGASDCKLVFVFDHGKLHVFTVSGQTASGCGKNSIIEGDYLLKN